MTSILSNNIPTDQLKSSTTSPIQKDFPLALKNVKSEVYDEILSPLIIPTTAYNGNSYSILTAIPSTSSNGPNSSAAFGDVSDLIGQGTNSTNVSSEIPNSTAIQKYINMEAIKSSADSNFLDCQ